MSTTLVNSPSTDDFTQSPADPFNNNDTTSSQPSTDDCLDQRYWFYFLASSLIVFFAGLALILLARLVTVIVLFYCPRCTSCSNKGQGPHRQRHPSGAVTSDPGVEIVGGSGCSCSLSVGCNRLKSQCQALLSGHSIVGRILVSTSCLLSLGSLGIYLYNASLPGAQVETCIDWGQSVSQQIDFAFNMFFLVYFAIRFLGADDKFFFWIELNSFVDYFTIPPVFVGIALSRQWLGLRFLRAVRLINIPDILQYLRILKTGNLIRLAQLLCIFASVWLASAGFVHLLELSGDPFYNFENAHDITYWECVYFVVVTMATVGYGDIYCQTILGRAFIVIFIFGALAMFASFIPEIADLIRQRRSAYGGFYEKPIGVKHVVVTGHITYHSVKNFVRDFFHEDRDTENVKSVFLDSRQPELKMEALFKRHVTRLVFIRGSVMNIQDLQRVKLHDAEAVLIMTNASSSDPDSEDAANIMRVISVKNFDPHVRVIVQLIHYRNKALCMNQPSWTSHDQVICLSELKLGFMATGCLAPGFSTLIGNLFIMLSYKQSKGHSWLDDYLRGTGMEVYCVPFSSAFHNKPFREVAKFCYDRLRLLVVAVTTDRGGASSTDASVVLNPGNDVIITSSMKGFIICQSEEESKRVMFYCPQHHGHLLDVSVIRHCPCASSSITSSYQVAATIANWAAKRSSPPINSTEDLQEISLRTIDVHLASVVQNGQDEVTNEVNSLYPELHCFSSDYLQNPESVIFRSARSDVTDLGQELQLVKSSRSKEQFDSTGLFHWCPDQEFQDCVLTNPSNKDVVRGLNGHVVLCCFSGGGVTDCGASCAGLGNFVMPLRASNLHWSELRVIVIVGEKEFLRKEWPSVCNFPKVYLKVGSPLNRSELRYCRVNRCHMCVVLTNKEGLAEDPTLSDKESILCTLNIKTMKFQSHEQDILEVLSNAGDQLHPFYRTMSGASIPILTELANDLNVQFLDQDDDDDPETPLYMTQPYASGRAFVASVLDTLMITAYFNRETLSLIRNFISGGDTRRLEYILAEGSGLIGGQHRPDAFNSDAIRGRCRVNLLPLNKGILADLMIDKTRYETLFLRALDEYGILCLGLYRLIPFSYNSADNRNSSGYRFVITNPPKEFQLRADDKVYCLEPFRRDRTSAETKL